MEYMKIAKSFIATATLSCISKLMRVSKWGLHQKKNNKYQNFGEIDVIMQNLLVAKFDLR